MTPAAPTVPTPTGQTRDQDDAPDMSKAVSPASTPSTTVVQARDSARSLPQWSSQAPVYPGFFKDGPSWRPVKYNLDTACDAPVVAGIEWLGCTKAYPNVDLKEVCVYGPGDDEQLGVAAVGTSKLQLIPGLDVTAPTIILNQNLQGRVLVGRDVLHAVADEFDLGGCFTVDRHGKVTVGSEVVLQPLFPASGDTGRVNITLGGHLFTARNGDNGKADPTSSTTKTVPTTATSADAVARLRQVFASLKELPRHPKAWVVPGWYRTVTTAAMRR